MILKKEVESQEWKKWQNFSKLHGDKGYLGGSALMQYNFEEIQTAVSGFLVNCITSVPRVNFSFLQAEIFFPQPPPSLSDWQYWGKVQWPLSGNQLIFIPGREEWVECIDVQTQTTALCVLETPDTWRNECPDNRVDCQDQSLAAHLGYTTWDTTEMD